MGSVVLFARVSAALGAFLFLLFAIAHAVSGSVVPAGLSLVAGLAATGYLARSGS